MADLFGEPLPIVLSEREEDDNKPSVLFERPLPVKLIGDLDGGEP